MSERLQASDYPPEMGEWPNPNNRDLDCGLCGAKEGEPHDPGPLGCYCRGSCLNQDGVLMRGPLPDKHVGSFRLSYEEGFRRSAKRNETFWNAFLAK